MQSAYFLAWPVLGTGIILGVTPSDEQLMQVMVVCRALEFSDIRGKITESQRPCCIVEDGEGWTHGQGVYGADEGRATRNLQCCSGPPASSAPCCASLEGRLTMNASVAGCHDTMFLSGYWFLAPLMCWYLLGPAGTA